MAILTPELESIMYSTVMQTQLAVGTSMQKGLKIPITLTQCLEPQPWNKLEIPERLNGEGVVIAIMASQGGFLLFIPDDGILLPAGYASTLSDPTEPLPVMAGELQRKLVPDAPTYVGKRVGRAKVFSSMARRAGIDDSAQILPVKLIIGDQESYVWFVGDVPHPERAFAKRNPDSEARSKKSKLFSDEILSNYSAESDFTSMFSDLQSKENSETPLVIEESENDISLSGGKHNRRKADLSRLLALKKNYGHVLPVDTTKQTKLPVPSTPVEEPSLVDLVTPEVKTFRVDSPHQANENTLTQPISEPEKDTIPETITVAVDDHIPAEQEKQPVEESPTVEETLLVEDTVEEVPVATVAEEKTLPEKNTSDNFVTVETDFATIPTEDVLSDTIAEPTEEIVEQPELIVESPEVVETVAEPIQQTVSETIVPIQIPLETPTPLLVNPVFSSMLVPMEAVISQRRISLNEIVRWKPGCVIEFGEINSSVDLVTKDVILAHGQPVENRSCIGLQLE